MAYLSGKAIAENPGMSVSRWMFSLAPIAIIAATIAVIKGSAQSRHNILTFFRFSPLDILYIDKRVLIIITFLASLIGISMAFNPFDSIMPILVVVIIFLFLLSVHMVIKGRMIDAIGILLISLPFINYAENQLLIWDSTINSEWITIKIAIILLFAGIWFIANFVIDKKNMIREKFNILILMFILTTFFSALFSIDIVYSLRRWLFEIIYPLIIYFIVINSIRYESDIRRFMSYLMTSVFLNLVMVLYYFVKYGSGNTLLDEYFLNVSFADGLLVANILIMTIPIAIAFLATEQKKSTKLLFFAMITIGMIGIVISFGRMAQISIAIGLLLFGLIKKVRRYLMPLIAVVLLFLIFNIEKLNPYLTKYGEISSVGSTFQVSSMLKRLEGWRAALEMFRDHPLMGVGIGRYEQEYTNYGSQYYATYVKGYVSMISAHNLYLNYLAETGIPGILLLLTIFSAIVIKGFSLIKKTDNNYAFKYSLLISVLIFLGNNLVDGITFAYVKEIDKGMVFWSITAVIISYGVIGKNQGSHLPDRCDSNKPLAGNIIKQNV